MLDLGLFILGFLIGIPLGMYIHTFEENRHV